MANPASPDDRPARVTVRCRDGRTFDVSNMTPDAIVDFLRLQGVTLDEIESTNHYLRMAIPQEGDES